MSDLEPGTASFTVRPRGAQTGLLVALAVAILAIGVLVGVLIGRSGKNDARQPITLAQDTTTSTVVTTLPPTTQPPATDPPPTSPPSSGGLTQAKFNQLTNGMTRAQVEGIVGARCDDQMDSDTVVLIKCRGADGGSADIEFTDGGLTEKVAFDLGS